MAEITLTVNGALHPLPGIDPDTPLLWVLRDQLNLVGTKFGCGGGYCGACTVHVDGIPTRSCSVPVAAVAAQSITTIEGLALATGLHPLQQAWLEFDVPQCGYCQAGQLMTAAKLLVDKPQPTDSDIDAAMTNLCRCGTYTRIRQAIHSAASKMAANQSNAVVGVER